MPPDIGVFSHKKVVIFSGLITDQPKGNELWVVVDCKNKKKSSSPTRNLGCLQLISSWLGMLMEFQISRNLPLLGWEFFSIFPDQKRKNQKSPIFISIPGRGEFYQLNPDSQLLGRRI
jgi:hypothetical protein